MKSFLLAACILGIAVCAPQMYMEFDIRFAPPEAAQAIPVGAPVGTLDVLLPVDDQKNFVGGPVRGFIKQDVIGPDGREIKEVYYPFGFAPSDPAAAAAPVLLSNPAAPAVRAAPAAPAAPAVPAQPVLPVFAVAAAPARPRGGDDDDEEDD
ncbi:secretory calcium-binding phosphoprotein 7 [Betta splendens]|uniref:Secretory calcium-binding phosphoprotein 7 n=1 Tax=Betta splendens TaxID=158456 RepID=A0A6P7MM36_BETSP|nr:secretory calcium-binding phosphoprotein 7 [Betta splendens]